MQSITILGATGSIGTNTLDVLARHPERFRVHALSGNRRVEELAAQCRAVRPARAVVADAQSARLLSTLLAGTATQVDYGIDALCEIAAEADTCMAAIVGAAGLAPTMAAVRRGRKVLLANKEALVMGGELVMEAVRTAGATLLPIDSEHNAIFQCLPHPRTDSREGDGVARLILTASGGPFLNASAERLANVTPDEACAHPNWVMGRKISVDSATMMNKGLEVIEARWLFDLEAAKIDVVIHPQSVIHSLVAYIDGSVIAQLGNPDMRTPIAYALAYPERIEAGVSPLDLAQIARLSFEAPDFDRFPCLRLAYQALRDGHSAPAVLNAANEVAVEAFLAGALRFTAIAEVVENTLSSLAHEHAGSLEDLMDIDQRTRAHARERMKEVA